jgi:hypothetical protein
LFGTAPLLPSDWLFLLLLAPTALLLEEFRKMVARRHIQILNFIKTVNTNIFLS